MQLALDKIGPVVVQLALAMLALLVAAFAPPAQGRMLLVPLDGKPVGPAAIAAADATPLKRGPDARFMGGRRGPAFAAGPLGPASIGFGRAGGVVHE